MLEWIYWKKTGQLPRDFDDYNELELLAMLHYMDELAEEQSRRRPNAPATIGSHRATMGGRPAPKVKAPTRWNEPVVTGDPLVDRWERQVARGEIPDYAGG